jgi:hypothetical protein
LEKYIAPTSRIEEAIKENQHEADSWVSLFCLLRSSQMSVDFRRTKWRYIPEDMILLSDTQLESSLVIFGV